MSLFLLTNVRAEAERARTTWAELFGQAKIHELSAGFHLAITDAHRKVQSFRQISEDGSVFGFGTFFSDEGFGEAGVSSRLHLRAFDAEVANQLYGHYTFVIAANDIIRVVTDPVGLVNVYWTRQSNGIHVSNDLIVLAAAQDEASLSRQGIQQFVFKEATIGNVTLFEDIHRLRLGHSLQLTSGAISEQRVFDHRPKTMSFEDYVHRIQRYFSRIALFTGTIGVELSAGFDTRLVAACASKTIPGIRAITNDNPQDGGVDEAIGPLVAQVLGMPHEVITRSDRKQGDRDVNELLHAMSGGRDVSRASATLEIAGRKYANHDLILGGYGGEVVRGKYCRYRTFEDFARNYYGGRVLKSLGLAGEFTRHVASILRTEYAQDWIESSEQLCQWLYAMDRMRIWGGARVTMMSLYGHNLHPFMDWHLLGPLLAWNYEDVKNGHLQERLIKRFAPAAMTIPINPADRRLIKMAMARPRIFRAMEPVLRNKKRCVRALRRVLGRFSRSGLERVYGAYPRKHISQHIQTTSGLDLGVLEEEGDPNCISRLATVQMALRRREQQMVSRA